MIFVTPNDIGQYSELRKYREGIYVYRILYNNTSIILTFGLHLMDACAVVFVTITKAMKSSEKMKDKR
jgi:hypothetical protein